MEKQMTYESAYQELEIIYAAINNEEVSIDELAKKVKRAAILISVCQAKLKSTEEEISRILSTMPDNSHKGSAESNGADYSNEASGLNSPFTKGAGGIDLEDEENTLPF